MHPALNAALAILAATSPAAAPSQRVSSVETQIIDLERQSWAAWQKQDVAFWQRHLSADHIELDGPNGPQDRNYVLKGVATRPCAVTSYNLDNFTVRNLDSDTALVVYRAAQEFACGEKKIPNVGWVTSLYQRRDGRWQNILFEHLLVPPPAKPAPKTP